MCLSKHTTKTAQRKAAPLWFIFEKGRCFRSLFENKVLDFQKRKQLCFASQKSCFSRESIRCPPAPKRAVLMCWWLYTMCSGVLLTLYTKLCFLLSIISLYFMEVLGNDFPGAQSHIFVHQDLLETSLVVSGYESACRSRGHGFAP